MLDDLLAVARVLRTGGMIIVAESVRSASDRCAVAHFVPTAPVDCVTAMFVTIFATVLAEIRVVSTRPGSRSC